MLHLCSSAHHARSCNALHILFCDHSTAMRCYCTKGRHQALLCHTCTAVATLDIRQKCSGESHSSDDDYCHCDNSTLCAADAQVVRSSGGCTVAGVLHSDTVACSLCIVPKGLRPFNAPRGNRHPAVHALLMHHRKDVQLQGDLLTLLCLTCSQPLHAVLLFICLQAI
jgi:hypothetical protein